MFSKNLLKLEPYTPGEQPQDKSYIKLNTNENPYPPSPKVENLLKGIDINRLNLYPDPNSTELVNRIADNYRVTPDNVFVGNGSDEILSLAFYSFFDKNNGSVLFPNFTYSFYPVYCSFYSLNYKEIALNEDFSIDFSKFAKEKKYSGIIFPNPNAPTGKVELKSDIKKLLKSMRSDRVLILDEAYVDFCDESSVDLIDEFENLLIIKTFSKSRSLAGARVGYALGDPKLIKALTTAKNSFNSYTVNYISQLMGIEAIKDVLYFNDCVKKIKDTREFTIKELKLLGWDIIPSGANFIFAKHPKLSGEKIYTMLKEKGILVRFFDKEILNQRVRISIGKQEDMEKFISIVKDF